jgi:hypothetical protein
MDLLCSSNQISENVKTTRDGRVMPEMDNCNLYAHFQYFVLSRLRILIHETLDIIRSEESALERPEQALGAYAAACILHFEVNHFWRNLRNGPLYQVSQASLYFLTMKVF